MLLPENNKKVANNNLAECGKFSPLFKFYKDDGYMEGLQRFYSQRLSASRIRPPIIDRFPVTF